MGENNSPANRKTEKDGNMVIINNKVVLWKMGTNETPQCQLLILREKKKSKICCQQCCLNFFFFFSFLKRDFKVSWQKSWRNALETHSNIILPFTIFILYLRDVSENKSHNTEALDNNNSEQIVFLHIYYLICFLLSSLSWEGEEISDKGSNLPPKLKQRTAAVVTAGSRPPRCSGLSPVWISGSTLYLWGQTSTLWCVAQQLPIEKRKTKTNIQTKKGNTTTKNKTKQKSQTHTALQKRWG